MAVDFSKSKTRENLMRAFAGESQARNRYTIAAKQASRDNLYSISQIFLFTADQERAHAESRRLKFVADIQSILQKM